MVLNPQLKQKMTQAKVNVVTRHSALTYQGIAISKDVIVLRNVNIIVKDQSAPPHFSIPWQI